jgi:NADH-quinone oxidoreductase subunit G
MAKITIDGKQLEVPTNLTIIQAARENGIHIPHFCWHPKLSVAGNCRICLVEVEKMPKLVIACATQVAEGMVVRTNSEKVVTARQAVMEFILINHPLDCPICDEAGECKLQDYAYRYSVGASRFDFEKVRKPKRVELGPNVMLDTERCIMCSRCIRFCDEIAKKPQLVFTQRNDHIELTTFPGEKLDNPYSMNVVDICPVGALTSRDFRFKARVWDMSSTETICPGCSRGCNISMWVRNNEILRLTPRNNPDVNSYWMCDHGRLDTFKSVNGTDRIKAPMVRKEGKLTETDWDEAIARVASELKAFRKNEIAAIGSPFSSNEDNYLLVKLMNSLGVKRYDLFPHVDEKNRDDILLQSDKTPNSTGARAVGCRPESPAAGYQSIMEDVKSGTIKALYILDDDIASDPAIAEVLGRLEFLVVHASNQNETARIAEVVLPCATYAERHGTFTNFQGRLQRIRPAVVTLELDRALDGMSMSRLDRFGAPNDRWMNGVRRDARPSWRILASVASAIGTKWKYQTVEDVFRECASTLPAFRGLTYSSIGSRGAMLSDVREKSSVNG